MQVITCSGTPYEIGYQHGQMLTTLVRQSRDYYRHLYDMSNREMDKVINQIETAHHNHFPELLEEMQGIADGAKLPYRDILYLNFYYGLTKLRTDHCSLIGVLDSPYGPLIAKNVDLFVNEIDTLYIQKVIPKQGTPYIHYGIAGTVWSEAGITEAGLAQVGAGLSDRQRNAPGWDGSLLINMSIFSRSNTVKQVLNLLAQHEFCQTLLIADRMGDMAIAELLPGRQTVHTIQDEHGLILHTNHSVFAEMCDLVADPGLIEQYGLTHLVTNSIDRYDNLLQLITTKEHSLSEMETILRNHTERGSICQHGSAGMHSAAGVIFAPLMRTMWGADGYPCQTEFIAYTC